MKNLISENFQNDNLIKEEVAFSTYLPFFLLIWKDGVRLTHDSDYRFRWR